MYEKNILRNSFLKTLVCPKLLFIMKLTWILLIVSILQVSASTFAQKITIKKSNVSLENVLKEIQLKTGISIFYADELVRNISKVNVDFTNQEVEKVLTSILSTHKLEFKKRKNSIVVVAVDQKPTISPVVETLDKHELQEIIIRGVIKDVNGNLLPGVTVKGKNISTISVSDNQGFFEIKVTEIPTTLSFNLMGFQALEKRITATRDIVVILQETVSEVDEVVVIGYGEVKKKDLTGSVVNVKMDDVRDAPVLSVDLALQGRVPGADIMASTGEPGAPASIRIRGTRSITATNEPLIVVDGVLDGVSNLTDINTADIESLSVLKDASATAIYGSRGSNGVIIITTKQGKRGKDQINLRSTFGISQLPRKLDLMNASQYAQYRNDYALFTSAAPYTDININSPLSAYPYPDPLSLGKGTDWVDEITRVASYHTHNLSLSGGTEKANYYASVAYDNTQGIIKRSGLDRITGRLNIDYKIFPWMKVGWKYNLTKRDEDQNLVTIGGTNWWNGAIYLNPMIKVYENFNDLWYSGQTFNSPRSILDLGVIRNLKRDGATNTGYIEIEPIANLKFNSQLTYYNYGQHTFRFEPSTLPAKGANEGALAYRGEFTEHNLMSQNTLNYLKKFNRHHIDFTAGFIGQKIFSDNLTLQGDGYQSDAILWNNMNAIPDKENYSATSNNNNKTSMSYLGRVNYHFNNKYYITLTGRRDGASNFASNNKWAFFPSGALKWNISEENFMKDMKWINEFSLRTSAGRTGNDGISSYRSLAALSSSTSGYLFNGSQPVAFYPSRLASDQLSWEKTDMYNVATDISLFDRRVNIVLEAYLSYTKDLLLDVQTPTQTGYTTRFANVGKTSNRGLEFSIETRNIEKENFDWSSSFSISHNRQMVDNIGHFDYVNVYGAYGNNSYMMYGYIEDYPLNALWGFQYAGTWKNQEEVDRNKITKSYVSASSNQYQPGSARYIDTNHDGVFNEQDQIYLGNADPFIYGGLQNNIRYKNLTVGLFLNYSLGGKIYNVSEQWLGNGGFITNQYAYQLDAWHPVRNPISDLPRAGSTDNIASSRMVHDASYLRLKSLAIGYNIDLGKITNNKLKSVQLGLAGENLFVWKKYNGFDPDVSSQSSNSTLRRVDIGAYPKPRTIVGSIQIRY